MPFAAALSRLLRSALALVLCVLLLDAPLLSAAPLLPGSRTSRTFGTASLSPRERSLHALSRFTFGPRPGEIDAVTREGLDRWFERQLEPQTIDDAALEARLAAFPAMRLPQVQLLARFPSNQLLRQAARQDFILPADPITRAIYADNIAFSNQAEKTAQLPSAASGENAAGSVSTPAPSFDSTPAKRTARPNLLGPDSLYIGSYSPKKPAAAALAELSKTMGDAATPHRQPASALHREDLYPESATATLLALPPEARVSRIVQMSPSDLSALRRSLSADELRRLSEGLAPGQQEILAALAGPERVVVAEILGSRLERDVYTQRQLEAVMTDFWLNHFNVYLRKSGEEPYLIPAFERDAIRHNALGKFENLLVAVTSSPAMLVYLDNAQSIGPDSPAALRQSHSAVSPVSPRAKPAAAKGRGLNENFARELLELHTLGVRCEVSQGHTPTDHTCGAGYTQADVTEVARVLTGWTVDRPALGSLAAYDDRRHQPGDKHVLGTTLAQNGEKEGLELLHRLATSPATARNVSTQLTVRFVSDNPPPALVDRLTAAWLKSGGDLRVVLRTLFHSPELWAEPALEAKVKTPLDFVVSALRATDADITNPAALVSSLDRLGMPLYGMPTPNGYSWLSAPWVSTSALVTRMNFAVALADNRIRGVTLHLPQVAAAGPAGSSAEASNSERLEIGLERAILSRPISEHTRQAILSEASSPVGNSASSPPATPSLSAGVIPSVPAPVTAASPSANPNMLVGLLLGSPEFQRR